jgi:prephenate dehydrogenase
MTGLSSLLSINSITLVGTGLLGGSLGLALRKSGFTGPITGTGSRPASLQSALEKACITHIQTDLAQAVAGAGLIVLAGPINTFQSTFLTIAQAANPNTIITDVGSTKASVASQAAASLGPLAPRFIGAHPMAGSEKKGPTHASPDLFTNRPCILTPTDSSSPDALAAVKSLWSSVGMRLIQMSPQEHDRAVALVSHLPHAAASCLVNTGLAHPECAKIASTGFRDTTRIGSGDPDLWREIFLANKDAVAQSLDQYIQALTQFKADLLASNAPAIHKTLADAKSTRDQWLTQFEKNQ